MNVENWDRVSQYFLKHDIEGAIRYLETSLKAENTDPFNVLIGAHFTNQPSSILSSINKFISVCEKSFKIKAVYLEMNGFDINYDRWFFDFFGYKEYTNDPDDLDWLSDWQSQEWPQVTLVGMETVQKDFEWYHTHQIYEDKRYENAYDLAHLLVMTKYASLIDSAIHSGKLSKSIPLLATAHDFDIIARF